jgi:hypothetical protein
MLSYAMRDGIEFIYSGGLRASTADITNRSVVT